MLGGICLIKAFDLDAALWWGRRAAPAATLPIEVRPFMGETGARQDEQDRGRWDRELIAEGQASWPSPPSPVAALDRAVAVAEDTEAARAYEGAVTSAESPAERAFLRRRPEALTGRVPPARSPASSASACWAG